MRRKSNPGVEEKNLRSSCWLEQLQEKAFLWVSSHLLIPNWWHQYSTGQWFLSTQVLQKNHSVAKDRLGELDNRPLTYRPRCRTVCELCREMASLQAGPALKMSGGKFSEGGFFKGKDESTKILKELKLSLVPSVFSAYNPLSLLLTFHLTYPMATWVISSDLGPLLPCPSQLTVTCSPKLQETNQWALYMAVPPEDLFVF